MDAFAKQIAKQIKDRYADEHDRLRLANKILAELTVETHSQKVHGGGLGELEACKTINLTWNSKKLHGCDAIDQLGRHVELKCTGVNKRQGGEAIKTNINYKLPENVDAYKHFATSPEYAGGHYWVVMNKAKSEVRWWMWIPQQKFANAIKKQLEKSSSVHINFGSPVCKRCDRGCKRWDTIMGVTHACTALVKK